MTNPPEQHVYLFVRQDIPLEHQLVQSNHATLSMASHYGIEGIPNLVLIGVPNQATLRDISLELSVNQIPHWDWTEPDFDFGFTAICTAPIQGQQRRALAQYQLWKRVIHPSPNCKAAASKAVHAGATPAG